MSGPDQPEPPTRSLLPEVAREIDQVAHFGSAPRVKKQLIEAAEAFDTGDFDRAIPPLLEAKTKAPRSIFVRELLGLAFHHLERWKDAARELAAYKRMSDLHNRDPELADCERALGRPEKAIDMLADVTAHGLDDDVLTEGLIVAAGAMHDLGRHDDAVKMLERGPLRPAGAVEPFHLRLWYALADALEQAGRRPEARAWWDAIYAEDPEFFDIARRRLGVKLDR
jgi:tetratricopeptide (TPR) repeat protein